MLRRAWQDIFSGQNVDAYLGILISLAVALLGLFGVANLRIVTAAILATLGLLALSAVLDRWVRIEMESKFFPRQTWDKIEADMRGRLHRARTVNFIGVSPLGILRRYGGELENVLRHRRSKIRFLIANPKPDDGEAMKLIAKGRPENVEDGKVFLDEISTRFGGHVKGGHLEVRLMNYIPSHVVTMIDDLCQDGVIFATVYSFHQVDPFRPSMAITRRDSVFYSFFQEEFQSLWNNQGHDYVCGEPPHKEG